MKKIIFTGLNLLIINSFISCSSSNEAESISNKSFKTVNTIAGIGSTGNVDGPGNQASFWSPVDIVVNAGGDLFVLDRGNVKIRKITPNGIVSTFLDASNFIAGMEGFTIDASGNLYLADTGFHKIWKVSTNGFATLVAGNGTSGSNDGNVNQATFYNPTDVAVDASGNLFVADAPNNKIRKITTAGVVSTFAGSGIAGNTDATGVLASFDNPHSIATDISRNVYVSEWGNHRIRKITTSGVVTTLAGGNTTNSSADGTGTNAGFLFPSGITIDSSGNLYVADYHNHKIRKITSAGNVTTIAGNGQGSIDGLLSIAKFNEPLGVTMDASGNLFVADKQNQKIRKISYE